MIIGEQIPIDYCTTNVWRNFLGERKEEKKKKSRAIWIINSIPFFVLNLFFLRLDVLGLFIWMDNSFICWSWKYFGGLFNGNSGKWYIMILISFIFIFKWSININTFLLLYSNKIF